YNPLSCQEKIEIPRKCPKDSPEFPFKGNPINITNGAKTQTETDFIGDGEDPLKIVRHYNTTPITQGLELPKPFEEEKFTAFEGDEMLCSGGIYSETTSAGSRSSNNREWKIVAPSACPILIVYKPSGAKIVYAKMSNPPGPGHWYASNDPKDGRIQHYASWYNYYDGSGKRYEFSRYMQLKYIRQGSKLTRFNYSGSLLTSYVNAYGRTLNYYYDAEGRNTSIKTPNGDYYKYTYDNNDNIIEVIYPDDTPSDDSDNPRKHYLFEDTRFLKALTGIIDESGNRYASWSYDQYGRAISSEHDSGVDKTEIEYIDGYSTRVKEYVNDTQYKETVYQFSRSGGKNQITSVEPAVCQNCSVGNAQYSYDPVTGNILQKIDENGIITSYEYDENNKEIKRTHAVGTSDEYIVETVWDASLSKPLAVTEPGRVMAYTYDTEGMMLTKRVTDAVTLEFRETTYSYNSKKALTSVNGPRVDVTDTTTYTYNPQGYKTSETNALGHTTTYSYHDSNGRAGQITDPNGVITYLTYNKKGQLISRTTNGQTTQLEYDSVGNLIQATAPDG
ncbi:MAG: hypothetical protein KZQ77_09000, partial [Candidatus Thiodiazotropha sp. (ex Notomyrtea botanica)]|nr:hypothetical protein [Candidatus Thiodiazotropha sp. (ex Notomyrtea botanica)]